MIVDAHFGWTRMDTNSEQPDLDRNIGRDVLGIPGTNGTRRFEGGWPRFQFPNNSFATFGATEGYMPYYRDRKSTRLNSSHRCISYAVFCLKKKKKTNIY